MKRLAFFAAVFVAVLVIPLVAQAHTSEELEQWRTEWIAQVTENGGITPEAMDEWQEMVERHGCDWPGSECPPPVELPVQHRTSSPARTAPATATPAPAPAPAPPPATNTGMGANVEQWRYLVEAYFQPADVPWAMRVMACESGGNPYAKNSTSTASGLFQFLRGWWSGAWGYPAFDPFNPEQNVKAAAWLYYNGGSQHWVCK